MEDYGKFVAAILPNDREKFRLTTNMEEKLQNAASDRRTLIDDNKKIMDDLKKMNFRSYQMFSAAMITELAKIFATRLGLEEHVEKDTSKKGHEGKRWGRTIEAALKQWENATRLYPKEKTSKSKTESKDAEERKEIAKRFELTAKHQALIRRFSAICDKRNKIAHEGFEHFAVLLMDWVQDEIPLWDPIFYHVLGKTVKETAEEVDEVPEGWGRRMPS